LIPPGVPAGPLPPVAASGGGGAAPPPHPARSGRAAGEPAAGAGVCARAGSRAPPGGGRGGVWEAGGARLHATVPPAGAGAPSRSPPRPPRETSSSAVAVTIAETPTNVTPAGESTFGNSGHVAVSAPPAR